MTDPIRPLLARLVGTWETEATHPAMPGVVVHGTATIEWLEGEHFLIIRSRTDRPEFPDALSMLGSMEHDRVDETTGELPTDSNPRLRFHYYDSRGVFRDYASSIDETAWRWSSDAPGFSQRFVGTFADEGNTIVGQSQLRRDDVNWKDDLAITYRRRT